jgi:predicted transcriptional regulator
MLQAIANASRWLFQWQSRKHAETYRDQTKRPWRKVEATGKDGDQLARNSSDIPDLVVAADWNELIAAIKKVESEIERIEWEKSDVLMRFDEFKQQFQSEVDSINDDDQRLRILRFQMRKELKERLESHDILVSSANDQKGFIAVVPPVAGKNARLPEADLIDIKVRSLETDELLNVDPEYDFETPIARASSG